MMDDHIREEYEKWKEDPVAWEENRRSEKERREAEEREYRIKHSIDNDDNQSF